MSKELFLQAISKFILGIVLVGLLIFGPAGTADFWNGWLLMGVLFIPMFLAGIIMIFKSPELLWKRLKAKETQREQDTVVKCSGLMFIIGFVTAGLNYRFHWSVLPKWACIGAAGIFLLSYLLYAQVLRENRYLSRAIEVQEGQRVVDTGLYSAVRHPMYSATLLLFLSMPLILGSLPSFVVFLAYPFLIAGRIRHEEAFLEAELEGYREYRGKGKIQIDPICLVTKNVSGRKREWSKV